MLDIWKLKLSRKTVDNLKLDSTGLPIQGEANDVKLIWNFKNENGKFINLSGDNLSLVHSGDFYTTFDSFLKDINLVIKGLKSYKLPAIKSIGLRYVNQIPISDESLIERYFNSDLHLLNYNSENEDVVQSISKVESFINNFLFSFQYGIFNPNYPSITENKDFILDYDCIIENDLDIDELEDYLNQMHDIIYDKFETSIKDDLRNKMREGF